MKRSGVRARGSRGSVGRSHEGLGSGDVVDGGDHAALDLEVLVNDLHASR
jgi:hypothetical protein